MSAGADAADVLGRTGEVTGSVTYGDPTDAKALETFPGEFLATDETGQPAALSP